MRPIKPITALLAACLVAQVTIAHAGNIGNSAGQLSASVVVENRRGVPAIPRVLIRIQQETFTFTLPDGFVLENSHGATMHLRHAQSGSDFMVSPLVTPTTEGTTNALALYQGLVAGRLPGARVIGACTIQVAGTMAAAVDLQWGGPSNDAQYQRSVFVTAADRVFEFRVSARTNRKDAVLQALNLVLLTLRFGADARNGSATFESAI